MKKPLAIVKQNIISSLMGILSYSLPLPVISINDFSFCKISYGEIPIENIENLYMQSHTLLKLRALKRCANKMNGPT